MPSWLRLIREVNSMPPGGELMHKYYTFVVIPIVSLNLVILMVKIMNLKNKMRIVNVFLLSRKGLISMVHLIIMGQL